MVKLCHFWEVRKLKGRFMRNSESWKVVWWVSFPVDEEHDLEGEGDNSNGDFDDLIKLGLPFEELKGLWS